MTVKELKEGGQLPELTKSIIQENISRYAEASRDFNPIHINEEFARKTQHGGTIAHGMLILAYISEMMTAAFGKDWITGGKLDVRFKAAARPGEKITVSGKITRLTRVDGKTVVTCSVLCAKQNGEQVITGEATLAVPEP
jgi:acyl dehydratase